MIVNGFLPVNQADMEALGWERPDYVLVSGDAYVDHPSFGTAVISRVLTDAGFKVAILAQPDWKSVEDFQRFGRPRLGFLVTGGNIDSMVNHYTVSKRRRDQDSFSPGGEMGHRPDRATIVYSNMIRRAYKKMPIILGGIEASLRRFAHYDYWDNKVRRSILVDAEADLLVYGMAEQQIVEIAQCMDAGMDVRHIRHIPGTCWLTEDEAELGEVIQIPDFDAVQTDKRKYAEAFQLEHEEQDPIRGHALCQKHGRRFVVQNPPAMPLEEERLDWVHGFNYQRTYHPMYEAKGGIPAIREVKFSIISERGCFGSCSFCALTFHQGRMVRSRSHQSILNEAEQITQDDQFKGYIHDIGGPTANFRHMACKKQKKFGSCKHRECLFPEPCPNLEIDHQDLLQLLRQVRKVRGVKKVFLRSGLRYDYLMADKDDQFFHELCEHHVSGQLKVAPEHIAPEVLKKMGKPGRKVYDGFVKKYHAICEQIGKEQYLVPYLMSSHPGSTMKSAVKLAEYLRDTGYQPEQVQDFYPTPGTRSTCMYYTGLDPKTMESIHVPTTKEEKALQRALLQYSRPQNYNKVLDALRQAGRMDLVGHGPKSLIRPRGKQPQQAVRGKKNPAGKGRKTSPANRKRRNRK